MDDYRTVTIYANQELRRWLGAESLRQQRSVSYIVRQALELYRNMQTPQVLDAIETASQERVGQ